ncbi:HpsJ family protein [Vulcanococcus limneticus]|uniref:HpsJ family protein n=1 Tax=Vulcanococcus limneticus TaxID=2170428 RepID=UPI00398C0D76
MTTAPTGRFGTLSRWLGFTLVVLLALQLLAVLAVNGWGEEAFRQLLVERLVTQAPMALVGLLLVLFGARLDDPHAGRTPLKWVVGVIGGVLALALLAAIPVSISGDSAISAKADQALQAQKGQVAMARAQLNNPQVLEQVIAQGEQTGQIPPTASQEEKQKAAKAFMERQLGQADQQIQQAERARDLATNQRRIGGTGTAVVLAIAFTLVALAALL